MVASGRRRVPSGPFPDSTVLAWGNHAPSEAPDRPHRPGKEKDIMKKTVAKAKKPAKKAKKAAKKPAKKK